MLTLHKLETVDGETHRAAETKGLTGGKLACVSGSATVGLQVASCLVFVALKLFSKALHSDSLLMGTFIMK